MMAMVSEGTSTMMAHELRGAAHTFAKERLAPLHVAVKSVPVMAQRGLVRAELLSPALFDQAATDRVYTCVPTLIQIPQLPATLVDMS